MLDASAAFIASVILAFILGVALSCVALTLVQSGSGVLDRDLQKAGNAIRPGFQAIARSMTPVTDKVTTHSYDMMYDLLIPRDRPIKLFEIGLGCGMGYGPGASAQVWQHFLHPESEIWGADIDGKCVDSARNKGLLGSINMVIGDQADEASVRRWVRETKGNFDVIIDDGGHKNLEILQTFEVLWKEALTPGGLYFIEDMQVGRNHKYQRNEYGGQPRMPAANKINITDYLEAPVMAEVVRSWVEQLLITPGMHSLASVDFNMGYQSASEARKHPIPVGTKFVLCQDEACAIGKCGPDPAATVASHCRESKIIDPMMKSLGKDMPKSLSKHQLLTGYSRYDQP